MEQISAKNQLVDGGIAIIELEPSQRDSLILFAVEHGFTEIKKTSFNKFTLLLKYNK